MFQPTPSSSTEVDPPRRTTVPVGQARPVGVGGLAVTTSVPSELAVNEPPTMAASTVLGLRAAEAAKSERLATASVRRQLVKRRKD